jgi:hypothetical protein
MNTLEQTSVVGSEKAPKSDAYTPWYTLWTGAFFLLVWVSRDLDRIFNLYILLVPILILPALVLAATLVISLSVNVIRRRWRRTISIIAAPIVAGSFFLLLGELGITTELIRLKLWKSSYVAQLEALPAMEGGPLLKSWDWGSTGGVAVANIFWLLVYDDSDQIRLPRSSWSADWIRKADQAAKGNGFIQSFTRRALLEMSRAMTATSLSGIWTGIFTSLKSCGELVDVRVTS